MSEADNSLILACVVPLHNASRDELAALMESATWFDAFVLVDDGSEVAVTGEQVRLPNALLVTHSENQGIAAALNSGIQAALRVGANAFITLDQDTHLSQSYVQSVREALSEKPRALVAPALISGVAQSGVRGRGLSEPIQSGMAFSADLFTAVGGFEEALFIDCVDTVFAIEAQKLGIGVTYLQQHDLDHQLGVDSAARLLGRPTSVSVHGPRRRYYITRNRVVVYCRYGFAYPSWALRSLRSEFRAFVRDLVAAESRRAVLLASLVGLGHAVVGRRGAIPEQLVRQLDKLSGNT